MLELGQRRDLNEIFDRLRPLFPQAGEFRVLDPVEQLLKSIISSRTRDEISWPAFFRLVRRFPSWQAMADAPVEAIEAMIPDITRFKDRATDLLRTLRMIAAEKPDFDLGFLAGMPVEEAVAWLRRFPGVGPKVAAAVLNFSTLRRAAFVVDTHVLRVLRRQGFVGRGATIERAHRFVMEAVPDWTPQRLAELHVVLKKLGQIWCRHAEPNCGNCPLAATCRKIL